MTETGFQLAKRQAEGYERHTRTFMEPMAAGLVSTASLPAGAKVLDLACGTGLVARHARTQISADGLVVGADVNRAMLSVAGSVGPTGIDWVAATAPRLPFAESSFTAVLCQQGFQFFPKPGAAAREAFRVLRPGGMLVATIWATPGRTPYIEAQLDLLAALDPALLPSARAATPSDARDRLDALAAEAGFDSREVTIVEHVVALPDLASYFLAQTATTPWAPTVAALSAREQQRLAAELVDRLASFAEVDGIHRIPFCSYQLRARKP